MRFRLRLPLAVLAVLAVLAACGCGGGGRVVNGDLGPGPRLPPPVAFAFACTYMPGEVAPPEAVVAICGANEPETVRVRRTEGGMRLRLRFPDVRGRALEVYVYRDGGRFERGARIVTRQRGEDPLVDTPESGWIAVQHYDRRKRAVAVQFALRYPGIVVRGTFREGDVPLPQPPPPAPRPDPWRIEDAGSER